MPRFVLEIGTEEIPPRYFPPALASLYEGGEAMLGRARLGYGEAKVYGTPRRLVFIAEGLAATQAPRTREERGPSARVAFDADGKPTKAAIGFARRHGLPPEKLERRQTEQGEYVFAIIQEPELPAGEALAPLLPGLITSISFPKAMRWGAGALRFGRPIRWLLALLDDQVVEFELDGTESGRLTRGHPTLDDGMHPVTHADRYETELKSHYVIVDQAERQRGLQEALQRIEVASGARILDLMSLWPHAPWQLASSQQEISLTMGTCLFMQTLFLVEWPTPELGRFDEAFLRLPRPVLEAEMRHVQSYFPLEDSAGHLLPRFVAVRDGGCDHLEKVIAGWESVLKAKLVDACYFYEQDVKVPLADRVTGLSGVAFQEGLGTMYEKVERIRAIAAEAAQQCSLSPEEARALDRAAYLCKADLTSDMVLDLSDLEGVMGGIYGKESGEPDEVTEAIGEHYRPRFAGDQVPKNRIGQLLGLSDKLDTVAASFAAGITPTGSADPYGLRREGTGLVITVLESRVHLSISRLIAVALRRLYEQVELRRSEQDALEGVVGFLRQRLDWLLAANRPSGPTPYTFPYGGVRYDLLQAALGVGFDDIRDAAERAWVIGDLANSDADFLPTVIASTRVSNIVKGFDGSDVEVDPKLFQHESETALWDEHQRVQSEANKVLTAGGADPYIELFKLLHRLREPIDRYFDDVLVMAEDERLRRNRLATCWHINQLFRRLADFTLVVQA